MNSNSKLDGDSIQAKIKDNDNQCPECFKVLSSKAAKNTHIKNVHENIRNFACGICGKCFKTKPVLMNHYNTFHEENPL